MKETVEKFAADIILQNPIEVKIGEEKILVTQPVTSTLVEVSKFISQLPKINVTGKDDDVLIEVLRVAHECEYIADIVAILILGRKKLTETVVEKRLFRKKVTVIDNQKIMKEWLLDNYNSDVLYGLMIDIFKLLKVDFFLAIITFLKEVSLIKKTKN